MTSIPASNKLKIVLLLLFLSPFFTNGASLPSKTCISTNKLHSIETQLLNLAKQVNDLHRHGDDGGYQGSAKDCAEYRERGNTTDGVYRISPDGQNSYLVRCDMTTDGGGWTIFQRRVDGSVDFYRGWQDYKQGFGNIQSEYWLGLDKVHQLTTLYSNELRVDMQDTTGNKAYAQYSSFAVSSETSKYQLSLGTYSGTAGDSFTYHQGVAFSTRDADNDRYPSSCAVMFKGAWWYKFCHVSNLNGVYHHGAHESYADGVNWYAWKGYYYSLSKTEMKIRRLNFKKSK